MEEQTFKIGDFVKHKALEGTKKIYVANATDEKILGRYVENHVIHSIELFNYEVELYINTINRPRSL